MLALKKYYVVKVTQWWAWGYSFAALLQGLRQKPWSVHFNSVQYQPGDICILCLHLVNIFTLTIYVLHVMAKADVRFGWCFPGLAHCLVYLSSLNWQWSCIKGICASLNKCFWWPVEADLSNLLTKDYFHSKVTRISGGGGGTPRHFLKD